MNSSVLTCQWSICYCDLVLNFSDTINLLTVYHYEGFLNWNKIDRMVSDHLIAVIHSDLKYC